MNYDYLIQIALHNIAVCLYEEPHLLHALSATETCSMVESRFSLALHYCTILVDPVTYCMGPPPS